MQFANQLHLHFQVITHSLGQNMNIQLQSSSLSLRRVFSLDLTSPPSVTYSAVWKITTLSIPTEYKKSIEE